MHLHKYQARQLFFRYGIPVPAGAVLDTAAAMTAAQSLAETGAAMEAVLSA